MSTGFATRKRATVTDLLKEPGKAELINGEIIRYMATGHLPSIVSGRIFRKLADFVDTIGKGFAYPDNVGFTVPELSSGRESFSPDAAFYSGPPPKNPMRFVEAAPDFAVEVRSEGDHGPPAEKVMAAKRADYFEAGTLAVWDVDPEKKEIRLYRSDAADRPVVFSAGMEAHAEPAVPGWRTSVDWLMA